MYDLLPTGLVVSMVEQALAEDVGSGDMSAQLMAEDKQAVSQVISRQTAVLCGIPWFNEVFYQLDPKLNIHWYVKEGETLIPNQPVCQLSGNVRVLLTGERTALNFLQLLSATATQTQDYVQAVAGTKAKILDTRKTLPLFRHAQKFAVRCGGGENHRLGLYDAFLIKENHIMAAGSIAEAVQQARRLHSELPVEVEVENLSQIDEALAVGVERLLLDNFSVELLKKAVDSVQGKAYLEASGNINLQTVRTIAETGVDFISVGALTKHVQAVDFSMRMMTA